MAVTLDSLKKTIGKKNVNSRAFAWLADLEREAGNLDQALQRVDGGLTLYPNDVAAMLVRSKILFQKESYDACIEECEKVLVADPFNLAAQQIMGDAYDKLENIGERNVCYRRLHDMDPLNTFWKDEYDVVVGAAAAAAMAGEISDTDFSMPDVGNMDLSDEFTAAVGKIKRNMDSAGDEISAQWKKINSVVTAWMQTDDAFLGLDSNMQNVATNIVKQIDFEKLGKTTETEIYAQLLILNVISLGLELLCCCTVKNMDSAPIFNIITNRAYLIYFATFVTLFIIYIYCL